MLAKKKPVMSYILTLNGLSLSIALAVYAYMGLFSRYIADDYCHSGLFKTHGFLGALQHHYLTFSNRYMILVIPYLTKLMGSKKNSLLPGLLILLWIIALRWLLKEVKLLSSFQEKSSIVNLFAVLVPFWVIFQAPDQYQSIFWEAGSVGHFVPLILTTLLSASILFVARKSGYGISYIFWSILYFVLTLLIGGFSEMNDALIFVLALLFFFGIFFWMDKSQKRSLILLISGNIIVASLVSTLIMAMSPGNVLRIGKVPTFFTFVQRILTYPIHFIMDTIKTLPVPTFLTVFISFLVAFSLSVNKHQEFSGKFKRNLKLVLITAPVLLYISLAVNFSPSAYALAYPVDRALLEARYLMTLYLTFSGIGFGFSLSQRKSSVPNSVYAKYIAMVILVIFSLYPLRAALQTTQKLDVYHERAAAWDERDAQIRLDIANGETNIAIPEFDSLHGIKEIDSDPNHWVNRCAAKHYGVETIIAVLP